MDRRNFLKITSSTVGLSILGLSSSAHALLNCSPFNAQGVQQCEAGIDSRIAAVTSVASGGQHMCQWCWAACIEMVFKYNDFYISQEAIVQQAFGNIERFPGQPRHILTQLNRNWSDSSQAKFSVSGESYSTNLITASQDLSQNMPLIIGNMGHTMVLTSMKYDKDNWGNGHVKEAEVIDPWPGQGQRILSPEEWLGTSFLVCLRVSRG
ncbi:MAG: hypothetical protein KJ804_06345 [Proteobacteria bacterium]|nr:hypothetical protein [Pseudomonadota bacterium]MBU1057924.1 hypothetical protein [Pseudomonadota bacterium]